MKQKMFDRIRALETENERIQANTARVQLQLEEKLNAANVELKRVRENYESLVKADKEYATSSERRRSEDGQMILKLASTVSYVRLLVGDARFAADVPAVASKAPPVNPAADGSTATADEAALLRKCLGLADAPMAPASTRPASLIETLRLIHAATVEALDGKTVTRAQEAQRSVLNLSTMEFMIGALALSSIGILAHYMTQKLDAQPAAKSSA